MTRKQKARLNWVSTMFPAWVTTNEKLMSMGDNNVVLYGAAISLKKRKRKR